MTTLSVLDAAGRRRSPATMPGYHAGRPPRNKGIHYPADPPTVDEIVAVMRRTPENRHGWRLRAMIVVLWRAGFRIQEALALAEHDLDQRRGSILVRNGKGGRRREVGMDGWGLGAAAPVARRRAELPVGPLFCIIDGPTRGRPWSGAAVRAEFRRVAALAGVRRRFAPHQLRHAHALELAREGVPLNIIQRQLGHANLGTTSIYLQGIDPEEIITAVRTRRADDVRQRRAAALIRSPAITSGSATALPLRSDRASASTPLGETILARPQQARRGPGLGRSHLAECERGNAARLLAGTRGCPAGPARCFWRSRE
jgi:integrase